MYKELIIQIWFLLARKGSQTESFSAINNFDHGMISGNAASERQENIVVNEGTNDRGFTFSTSSSNIGNDENTVDVKTLERSLKTCFRQCSQCNPR